MNDHALVFQLQGAGLRFRDGRAGAAEPVVALRDIDLQIRCGESVGLIGRNGSGKTTLLKLLAGIYEPDSGVACRPPSRVALMSLSLGFDSHLSGRDNAIFGLMLLGHRYKDALLKVDEVIAFSELGAHADQPVGTYSSGMRSRLAFSVAVSAEAEILLIDEVLAVGDAGFRRKAEKQLTGNIARARTHVLVSHSTQQVRKLCQRAIWLENGSIVADGPSESVTREYDASFKNS